MVMNEMKLDMSMPDHRKVVKKYEKVFVGVMTPEGDVINFADENKRKPDSPL
jgi:Fe-S cluster biosynthesis and repair protein YggX